MVCCIPLFLAPAVLANDGAVVAPVATEAPATQPAEAPKPAEEVKTEEPKEEVKAEEVKEEAATTAETQAWWQGILVLVIQFVAAVATPVLSMLLIMGLRKWNIKLEQDKVEWALGKAVGYGEQAAKKALKDGKPLEGPAVMKIAVEQGDKLLKQYKVDKKVIAYLEDLIEAKLGEKELEKKPQAPKEDA